MKCLEKFYGAKDVKNTIELKTLKMLQLPIKGLYEEVTIQHGSVTDTYIIDLYEARESCCGPDYKDIMNKWLPKGKALEDLKNILLNENDIDS